MPHEKTVIDVNVLDQELPEVSPTLLHTGIPVDSLFKVDRENSIAYCVVVEKYFFIDREEFKVLLKNKYFSSVYASNDAAHPGQMVIRFVKVKEA